MIITDITTIGSKVKWFSTKLRMTVESRMRTKNSNVDMGALAELLTMMKEFNSCTYVTRNSYAHEKVSTDWSNIPTHVEQMCTSFAALTKAGTNLRTNRVMCGMISDVMCIVETADSLDGG